MKRRAKVADDIERTHEALQKMALDLESLDATIVQFDPDFQVETIKPKAFRPPKDWSNRGQMSRIILSICAKPQNRAHHPRYCSPAFDRTRVRQERPTLIAPYDKAGRRVGVAL